MDTRLYRRGPAKLHAFGRGDSDEFKLADLNSNDRKGIMAMFRNQDISYTEVVADHHTVRCGAPSLCLRAQRSAHMRSCLGLGLIRVQRIYVVT